MSPLSENRLDYLNDWLRNLLPSGAHGQLSWVKDCLGDLYQDEEKSLANATVQRQREFLAGRVISHLSLTALGCPPQAVLRGKDGAPIWPEGFCGSIAHKQGICGAIVANKDALSSVGLDIELEQHLTESVWKNFINEREFENSPDFGWKSNVLFSCKEAAFKCLSSSGLDSANIPLREISVTISEDIYEGLPVICRFKQITLEGRVIVHRRIVVTMVKNV